MTGVKPTPVQNDVDVAFAVEKWQAGGEVAVVSGPGECRVGQRSAHTRSTFVEQVPCGRGDVDGASGT